MKKISKKTKIIVTSLSLSVVPITLTSTLVPYYVMKNKEISEYKNVISSEINNFETKVNDKFVKGADISSYADVIENLLFQDNIKDENGNWYTYKDFENTNIKVWDNFQNKDVTLEEYANNNLYSYFDDEGNRVYDNLFSILRKKGINSLRLKLWVNPNDENGNSYGGGHNDLDTDIFIIKQAKKYGFDDFLLDFHYSDFWTDPSKQYMPRDWQNLNDDELIQEAYDYTYETLEKIYSETGVVIKRIQYGNEINYGFLWTLDQNNWIIKKDINFLDKFISSAMKATEDFNNKHNEFKIEKSLHFGVTKDTLGDIRSFENIIRKMDTILLSSYIVWGSTFNKDYEIIKAIKNIFPNQKIILGEIAVHYNSEESEYINDATKNTYDVNWTSDMQTLITHQYMQFLSKLSPEKETGMYWWEIGELYIGRLSWASKEGIKFFKGNNYKVWRDINNWSQMNCFDNNAIALPSLDSIHNFERNIDENKYNIFSPMEYFQFNEKNSSHSEKIKLFYEQIKFSWPKSFSKQDISKIMFDKNNVSVNKKDIDIEIYLNKQNASMDEIKNNVIKNIKDEYKSLMYTQISFKDFEFNPETNLGSITLFANENSFYYKNPENNNGIKLNFKVYNEYLTDTIDLTSKTIKISKNDKEWYSKIISELNSQPNWAFGNQIWDYLKISGGATEDNKIWLYDNNKQADRNAEFFLLKNDQIRLSNNTVDYEILNKNKEWINDFSKYKLGNNTIYFAVRKGINDINWEYDIPSTFSQIGKESWKYIDLLVYKLSIELY